MAGFEVEDYGDHPTKVYTGKCSHILEKTQRFQYFCEEHILFLEILIALQLQNITWLSKY